MSSRNKKERGERGGAGPPRGKRKVNMRGREKQFTPVDDYGRPMYDDVPKKKKTSRGRRI